MYFPADRVLEACKGNLEGSKADRERAILLLLGDPPHAPTQVEMLIPFLSDLPNAEEQERLLLHLEELAREYTAKITDLNWWDINPGEHWLWSNVERDGRSIPIALCWKDVVKGKENVLTGPHTQEWVRDRTLPLGWHYRFTHPEYHSLMAAFESWMKQPLPPFPGLSRLAPRPDSTSGRSAFLW